MDPAGYDSNFSSAVRLRCWLPTTLLLHLLQLLHLLLLLRLLHFPSLAFPVWSGLSKMLFPLGCCPPSPRSPPPFSPPLPPLPPSRLIFHFPCRSGVPKMPPRWKRFLALLLLTLLHLLHIPRISASTSLPFPCRSGLPKMPPARCMGKVFSADASISRPCTFMGLINTRGWTL